MATLSAGTIGNFVTQLRLGYWRSGFDPFGFTKPHSYNLGSSGTGPNSNLLIYDYDGWSFFERGFFEDGNGLTVGRRKFVDRVFQDLKSRFAINYRSRRSTDSADSVDFWFRDDSPFADKEKAYCSTNGHFFGNSGYSGDHVYVNESDVNVDAAWFNSSTSDNDYVYQTFYHEVLHGLGLGHPGNYNVEANLILDRLYANDSWQMSIMSYFSQDEVSADNYAFLITPSPADIQVLRSYYGSGKAFLGDTTYGVNTTITASVNFYLNKLSSYAATNAFCIQDDGGVDLLDFSNFSANQRIDLSIPTLFGGNVTSNVGGLRGNMTLAVGTQIENVRTGSGADTITGNGAGNRVNGGLGADVYTLKGGADIYDFNFGTSVIQSGSRDSNFDRITDLAWAVDKIDLLTASGGALATPLSLTRVADNTGSTIPFGVAAAMFQGLAANSARICKATNSLLTSNPAGRWFLAINDSSATWSRTADLFIEITGITSPPAIGSITPSTLFV